MDRNLAVKKVKAYAQNPDIIKEPSMGEMADLVVLVLSAVEQIEEAIKAGRLDGRTPEADKDYISRETAIRFLQEEVNNAISGAESNIAGRLVGTEQELITRVEQALQNIRNGKDGIITEEEIERAAEMAAALIETPDFEGIITGAVQANGFLIRDALESIPEGEDQLRIEAIQNLRQELDDIKGLVGKNTINGGLTRGGVLALIAESGSGLPDQTGNSGKFLTTNGTDASWATLTGGGDMAAAVYDPQAIAADAFDRANHTGEQAISTVTGLQTALDGKQSIPVVVSGSLTAANDARYINVASATYTDPSPAEGKGFIVFVRNGTATVGGTGYSTTGTIVHRVYHSGAWANYVYNVSSTFATTAQGALADTALQPADVDDTPVNGATTAPVSSNWAFDHAATAASDTAAGHVELATIAETNTGTDASRAVTADGLAGSYAGTKSVSVLVFDGATDVATGDGKAYVTIPEALNGMNLIRAQATVVTAGTTNATTIMIHNKTDAADMLSGAISIASTDTVGTVGTINTSTDDVVTNDVLRIDVDSVSTTAPKGLMIVLEFRLP